MKSRIIEAVAVASEVCGTQLSAPAARAFAGQLALYDEGQVIHALKRCMRELKGRLTLAEVLSRIDDGRPGADEAWAMLAWDEETTVVLSSEMQSAQGVAWHTYHAGDRVGARLAFKEAYIALVQQARSENRPVEWKVSLGWDREGRIGPIQDAIAKGLLTPERATGLLPDFDDPLLRIRSSDGLTGLRQIAAGIAFENNEKE